MQSQIIGMQSSLDRILSVIQANNANFAPQTQFSDEMITSQATSYMTSNQLSRGGALQYYAAGTSEMPRQGGDRSFPPLPGFAPPVSVITFTP